MGGLVAVAAAGFAEPAVGVVVWNIRSGQRIIEIGDELDDVLGRLTSSSDQNLDTQPRVRRAVEFTRLNRPTV